MRKLRPGRAMLRLPVECTGEESDGMSSVVAPFERSCAPGRGHTRGGERWVS